jgi:hypothetical protein
MEPCLIQNERVILKLPVVNGRVGGHEELQDALLYAADSGFWEQWLQHYLGMKDPMPAKVSLPNATVAVCTRGRTDDLQRCLKALSRLRDDGQELMVVDNCPSSDSTRRLVEGFRNVHYVIEKRPAWTSPATGHYGKRHMTLQPSPTTTRCLTLSGCAISSVTLKSPSSSALRD